MDDWVKLADFVSKCAQVAFFGTMATLGIVTYRNAVRGLWSSVNTEYYKRVIESLAKLSDELIVEFDFSDDSKSWMALILEFQEAAENVNAQYKCAKENGVAKPGERWDAAISQFSIEKRLQLLSRRMKSDPFLPDIIREDVCDYCTTRSDVYRQVLNEALRHYGQDLVNGKCEPLDENGCRLWNQALKELHKRGCGIDELESEAHAIRLKIKTFLTSFLQPK